MPNVYSKPYTPVKVPFDTNPSQNLQSFILECIEEKYYCYNGSEADDYLDVIINDEKFLKNEAHDYLEYFVDGHTNFIKALMNTLDFEKLVLDLKQTFADEIEKLINYYSECDDADCDWSGCVSKHAKAKAEVKAV